MSDKRGDDEIYEGDRVGRFLVVRDVDGNLHAVAAGSVAAVCATDAGTVLMLPGGKMVLVSQSMAQILAWLDGRR